jgi:hypothetical protein
VPRIEIVSQFLLLEVGGWKSRNRLAISVVGCELMVVGKVKGKCLNSSPASLVLLLHIKRRIKTTPSVSLTLL